MSLPLQKKYSVVIIGSGPSGIAAAITLKKLGIDNIIVLEREAIAGGVPRHCGHIAFGFKHYKRILTGPQYAAKNISLARSLEVTIQTNTTVVALGQGGELSLLDKSGTYTVQATRVLIATGTRELPRSARFVSGDRAIGIYNTGALQGMVYLKNKIPFKRPLIVGTEIVSFSALLTCKNAGIKPVAMVEENPRPTVRWPIYLGAKFFDVELLVNTQIHKIIGADRVEAVTIKEANGSLRHIDCDGILFTGKFTPESSLVRMSHLKFDSQTLSPTTNSQGQCSDPSYYAAGNVKQLSPEEGRNKVFYPAKGQAPNALNVSGACWEQGANTAKAIAQDLLSG